MFRRAVAALLVLGWICLSGFDVVEDLDEAPGRAAFSAADDAAAASKRAMGPLANNIIESAGRSKSGAGVPGSFCCLLLPRPIAAEFRRHSQLHKLFHVFLI